MQLTAAVINAGLVDLTLGLQMSGFHVVGAFESEEKAALIHKLNLDVPLHQLPLEGIDPTALPNVDLLAAHLYHPSHSRVNPDKLEQHDSYLYRLQEILFASRPRAFLLLINAGSIKNDRFRHLIECNHWRQGRGRSVRQGSAASGEGLVNVYRGTGRVLLAPVTKGFA